MFDDAEDTAHDEQLSEEELESQASNLSAIESQDPRAIDNSVSPVTQVHYYWYAIV